jgi:hypothetical protein
MAAPRSMRLSPRAEKQPARPLAERGRMLFVADVLALLPKRPNGKPVKSAWWVRTQFAPDKKHRLGRDPYWWECDVLDFLDREAA